MMAATAAEEARREGPSLCCTAQRTQSRVVESGLISKTGHVVVLEQASKPAAPQSSKSSCTPSSPARGHRVDEESGFPVPFASPQTRFLFWAFPLSCSNSSRNSGGPRGFKRLRALLTPRPAGTSYNSVDSGLPIAAAPLHAGCARFFSQQALLVVEALELLSASAVFWVVLFKHCLASSSILTIAWLPHYKPNNPLPLPPMSMYPAFRFLGGRSSQVLAEAPPCITPESQHSHLVSAGF
jgi:hypothetical protein